MLLLQALFTAPLCEVHPLPPKEPGKPRQIINTNSKGNSEKHWQNNYFCVSKCSLLLNPSHLVKKNMGERQLRKKSNRESVNTFEKYIVEFSQTLNMHTNSPQLRMFICSRHGCQVRFSPSTKPHSRHSYAMHCEQKISLHLGEFSTLSSLELQRNQLLSFLKAF